MAGQKRTQEIREQKKALPPVFCNFFVSGVIKYADNRFRSFNDNFKIFDRDFALFFFANYLSSHFIESSFQSP